VTQENASSGAGNDLEALVATVAHDEGNPDPALSLGFFYDESITDTPQTRSEASAAE
jgi:hypothetical protein